MADYFLPLYLRRQKPALISLERLSGRCFVLWSAFAALDESQRTQQELDLDSYKAGLLAYVYYDLVAHRLRMRVQNKVRIPFAPGARASTEPYENPDITHAEVRESATRGLVFETSAEADAFAALASFTASKWNAQEAMLNALSAKFADAIEVLGLLAMGEQPKSMAQFQQTYGIRVTA